MEYHPFFTYLTTFELYFIMHSIYYFMIFFHNIEFYIYIYIYCVYTIHIIIYIIDLQVIQFFHNNLSG